MTNCNPDLGGYAGFIANGKTFPLWRRNNEL